jgi:hypothetical protein
VQAEEGLQAKEDAFYSQVTDDIDAAEVAYYRQAGTMSAGEPSIMGKVIVEDCDSDSDDELLYDGGDD